MMGAQGLTAIEAGICIGRGMRVVLFDQDLEIRATVRATIEQDRGFVLAGECREWPVCEVLLDRFVPELLIASVPHVPPKFLEKLSNAAFPVLVGLRGEDNRFGTRGLYDTLRVPPEPEHVRSLLGRVQFEIYRRKADELSSLLQRYMTCSARNEPYLSRLKVEDETQTHEIALEQVRFIAADGNYLRVHTQGQAHEIRETMTGIAARLDPSRFARVHRSFIVNLSHVLDLVTKDGSAAFVRLSDETEVPIGPNYREEFESALHMRDRLSA